jgi:hypothetical protein
MKYYFYLLTILTVYACSPTATPETDTMEDAAAIVTDSAAWVVENAILRHGGEELDTSKVSFVFRKRQYLAERIGNTYICQRQYTNDAGEKIEDKMTNIAFTRMINGVPAKLTAKDSLAYANSLNSVMYFAFLPYFLQDPAVNISYHGKTTIKDIPYYELAVSFSEDGGGEDFEDQYAYWFRQSDFTLDYLAYNFLVNGGGARFREAYNSRKVNGIVFQDYVNYKPSKGEREVLRFDDIYNAGGMDTLSLIVLQNVQ